MRLLSLHLFIQPGLREPSLKDPFCYKVFNASEQLFHTGWFVESLATQTLVIFIIRTAGNPFRSRPSVPLTVTTIAVIMAGIVIPFTSLGKVLGFTPLPVAFFLFLAGATVTYLFLVELVKRKLLGRLR